jgi:O-Antigen Polymerase.
LTNNNTLAFSSLLIIALSLENKNYFIAPLSFIILLLTKSIGGIISFFIATFIYLYLNNKINKKLLFIFSGILIIFLFTFVDINSVIDRLQWWKKAVLMFIDRPIYGWGYSSSTYINPAYNKSLNSLNSIYIHNYYLEFLCENGIITFILWIFFLFKIISNSNGFYKYGLYATMIHNIIDFGMSTIPNFLLFILIAMSGQRKKVKIEFKKIKNIFDCFFYILSSIIKWINFSYENIKIDKAINHYYKYYPTMIEKKRKIHFK